jgi:apolipoprotein N-acyltransferase
VSGFQGHTPYVKYGNIPALALALILLAAAAAAQVKAGRSPQA